MGRLMDLFARAADPASWWPGAAEFSVSQPAADASLKVLLVVAHPDDESECAATVYRITHELGGVVDQMVVTDGAAGQRFSAPARAYYGLSQPAISKQLPRLRRRELLRAGRILGIRNHYFLDQKDTGFTLDPAEGLRSWDLPRIRQELRRLLRLEQYDMVLTLLPEAGTHGHHQSVALLALEAVEELPKESRPVVGGVRTGSAEIPPEFDELPGFPLSRVDAAGPLWAFDRRTPLAQNPALDHSIIVHWVIAEHKSQGMFQMEYGRHTHEYFWQFSAGREGGDYLWLRWLGPRGGTAYGQGGARSGGPPGETGPLWEPAPRLAIALSF